MGKDGFSTIDARSLEEELAPPNNQIYQRQIIDGRAPTINDFTKATHDHTDDSEGGTLSTDSLADGSITTVKLADDAVTAAKIEAQEAWIAVTFQNSWVDYDAGATFNTAAYFKDSLGMVHLKGLVKNGTMGASIFTLPVGYRPIKQQLFTIVANNTFSRMDITTGGAVQPTAGLGTNAFVQLDNIHFRAEQ